MEHVIAAPHAGIVRGVTMQRATWCAKAFRSSSSRRPRSRAARSPAAEELDLDHIRDDLRENIERHALTLDENRPEAVARRRKNGYKMPRENIERLVDPGSFDEYWPLIVARQHQRNTLDELRKNTPGDGVVAGMCKINGDMFDETRSRAALVHYDYTVLAGTQGRPQPLQAGPHVRAGASLSPADDHVRRGRRRPARRRPHRPARGDRHQDLHHLRAALRPRADDLGRQRPLLCRQHRAGRLLGRDHRHRRLDARHGRAGDDRGRRPRHLHAGGSRADVVPGAERRGRHPGQGRVRRRRHGEEVSLLLPGRDPDLRGARPAQAAVRHSGKPPAALRHARRSCTRWPTRTPCWRSARNSASASSPRSPASRAGRWA